MPLKFIPSHSIPNGTKFFALFNDGSGGSLFLITNEGELLNCEGESCGMSPDTYLLDAQYLHWVELPKSFKFWFEHPRNIEQ